MALLEFSWKTLLQSQYPAPVMPGPAGLFAPGPGMGARMWLRPGGKKPEVAKDELADFPSMDQLLEIAVGSLAILTYEKWLPGYFHDACVGCSTLNWTVTNPGSAGIFAFTSGFTIVGTYPVTDTVDISRIPYKLASVGYEGSPDQLFKTSDDGVADLTLYHGDGDPDLRQFYSAWDAEWQPGLGPVKAIWPDWQSYVSFMLGSPSVERYVRATCSIPRLLVTGTVGLRIATEDPRFRLDIQMGTKQVTDTGTGDSVESYLCVFTGPSRITIGRDIPGSVTQYCDQSSDRIAPVEGSDHYGITAIGWSLNWDVVSVETKDGVSSVVCSLGANCGPTGKLVVIGPEVWADQRPSCVASYLGLDYTILSVTIDRGIALLQLRKVPGSVKDAASVQAAGLTIEARPRWKPDRRFSVNSCMEDTANNSFDPTWVYNPTADQPYIDRYNRLSGAKLVESYKPKVEYWGNRFSSLMNKTVGFNNPQTYWGYYRSDVGATVPVWPDDTVFNPEAADYQPVSVQHRRPYWSTVRDQLDLATTDSDVLAITLGKLKLGRHWIGLCRTDGAFDCYEAKTAFLNQSFDRPAFRYHPLDSSGNPAPTTTRYVYAYDGTGNPAPSYICTLNSVASQLYRGLINEVYDNSKKDDVYVGAFGYLITSKDGLSYYTHTDYPGFDTTSHTDFEGHAFNYSNGYLYADGPGTMDYTQHDHPFTIQGHFTYPAGGGYYGYGLEDPSGRIYLSVAQLGRSAYGLSASTPRDLPQSSSISTYTWSAVAVGTADLMEPYQPAPTIDGRLSGSTSGVSVGTLRIGDKGDTVFYHFNNSWSSVAATDGVYERVLEFLAPTGKPATAYQEFDISRVPRGLWAFNRTSPAAEVENVCIVKPGLSYKIASPLVGLAELWNMNPEVGLLTDNTYVPLKAGTDCLRGIAQGIEVSLAISSADQIPTELALPASYPNPYNQPDIGIALPNITLPGQQTNYLWLANGTSVGGYRKTNVLLADPTLYTGPGQPLPQGGWPLYRVTHETVDSDFVITSDRQAIEAWVAPKADVSTYMTAWSQSRPTWKPLGPFRRNKAGELKVPKSAWRSSAQVVVYDMVTGLRLLFDCPSP